MKILIDTHIFLWSLAERSKLDERRQALLQSRANSIYVSSISIAELMIKTSVGKMNIDFDRMLIAQAIAHNLPIMTDDHKIRLYDCRIL